MRVREIDMTEEIERKLEFLNEKGKIRYGDGEYEGEVKRNENGNYIREGRGTILLKNGVKFVGSFKDDVPHGIITKHYPDGTYEILEFKKGEVEGIKVMRHINGYGHIEENYSEKDFILKSIEGQVEITS